MINIPPIKQSSAVKPELIPDITKSWKVGQVLNATTQQGGEALSKVLIRVGQHTIEAKTPVTLQNGQEIKLQVKSLTDNQSTNSVLKLPLLSIIETSPVVSDSNKLAALKLRQFIAIQQSFSQLQQLANELTSNKTNTDKLPETLKNLIGNLQNTLQLSSKGISPAQLKQQILNSGVFLESKLLQPQTSATEKSFINDFKFQLLAIKAELSGISPANEPATKQPLTPQQLNQLQTLIKEYASRPGHAQLVELTDKLLTLLPKTSITQIISLLGGKTTELVTLNEVQSLAKLIIKTSQQHGLQLSQQVQELLQYRLMLLDLNLQVEQAISKITSMQLQPMSREGDNMVLLLFNLVFKDNNERFDIDFRIQQENESAENNADNWSVTLTFNFRTLGKVQSIIHLNGNQVSSVFHTELKATADKIKQLLPLLEAALKKTGLNLVNLSVDNTLLNNRPFVSDQVNLLDEKA
ncbi:MAG: flagellar hook-length control protein FliK [Gammaproteobacteria bacterium]|nr:flagellar hook-length control protein FliK [Gammaproteobacteria bacterium]